MKQGIPVLFVSLLIVCFTPPTPCAETTSSPAVATTTAQKPVPTSDALRNEVSKESTPQPDSTDGTKSVILAISLTPAVFFVIFLLIVKRVLQKGHWSLTEALSESETTLGPSATPVFARSASRFIAFIGFFAIILWIVGLSIPTLYRMMSAGEVPDLGKVSTFLLAQAGIFAPYIINKLAGAITSKPTL